MVVYMVRIIDVQDTEFLSYFKLNQLHFLLKVPILLDLLKVLSGDVSSFWVFFLQLIIVPEV